MPKKTPVLFIVVLIWQFSNAQSCTTTIDAINITCFGANNGSALATITGGGISYTWSNGETTQEIFNLSPGSYSVTAIDAAGCTDVETVVITEPPLLSMTVNATGETVVGAHDGTAMASPAGGTPPFLYHWNNGAATPNISGLLPGLYTLTVTDAGECTVSGSATVAMGTTGTGGGCKSLPVYALLAPAEVCGNTPFTLEADDLYPNPVVKYVWLFPNGDSAITTQPSLTVVAHSTAYSGAYFVLRDSSGCRSIAVGGAPVTILTVDNISAGSDAVLCTATSVQLTASLPASGTGSWVSLGAATVDAPGQNQTMARNIQPGANAFVWQVALGNCPQAAIDTVIYFLENKPVVQDDHYTLQRAFDVAVMEVLLNDALGGLSDTLLLQLSSPATGNLELLAANHRFRYTVDEDFRGSVNFQYAVCNPASVCNLPCDTATVTIDVQNMPTVPTGLVVEGNGANGALTIHGITGFSRVEVTIADRWGDVVFSEADYKNSNPWTGTYKRTGQYLPGGAYFYFLKAYDDGKQFGNTMTGVIHLFETEK